MNSKRISYLMIGALAVLVLAMIGGAYAASNVLQKQADTLSSLKLKNKVLDEEKISLKKAKKDVAKYSELQKIAKTIVPQDKDQAKTVREIVNLAQLSGINPSSITFPASTLGAASGAKPAAGNSGLTQLTPVAGNAGLYMLPITITQDASSPVGYNQFIDFLGRLENNRRTAQVSSISLQPAPQNRNTLSFTLTVDKYIKP